MGPKLSILTVTYQAEETLPLTLRSVAAQTWTDWEHLFVDGASRDGTIALIREYAEKIGRVRWISEPDRGLYDAMNKALQLAEGEFVIFLNAGDAFWAPDTLEKVFTQAPTEADVLYGDHRYVDRQGQLLLRPRHRPYPQPPLRAAHFQTGMVICHQALIVRREKAPLFDLNYRLAADLDWTIRLLATHPRTYDTRRVLIRYLAGGLSAQRLHRYLRERTQILYRHFGWQGVGASLWAMAEAQLRRGYAFLPCET
ncbi:MAG: glycosyl transferase [Bacteroidia bacterium]|nr:MAG: glycosyl transferase [Bacteroidia bacterium]